MKLLSALNITKSFPTPTGELSILKEACIEMDAGENLAIIGPSGSGKSTLLHILGTLDTPTSGELKLAGISPFNLSEADLAKYRNANIGFIFQEHHLLPHLNVVENVLLPTMATGSPTSEQIARAKDLVHRVGLGERITHRPAELSGGEKQRVAVARALMMRPKLILADEPTGSLDRANATKIGELLLQLPREENVILVCVTHSQELAERFTQRAMIEDGVLVDVP